MGRTYTVEKVSHILADVISQIPHMGLSTDIIVGFPGETEEDFEKTRQFLDTFGFEMAYVFKYSPRPGTPAFNAENSVPEEIKESRHRILLSLVRTHSERKHRVCIGSIQEVLIEGHDPKGWGKWRGRTPCNKRVILDSPSPVLGQILAVKIESASANTLYGRAANPER
jgi:tRNA-2-methylthio-N6-dimethylallyladenosine synthase